jgi:hypothetical protein
MLFKILFQLFIIYFSFIPLDTLAHPTIPVDVNYFLENYDSELTTLLTSYHEEVKDPLTAKIFDISNPLYYRFLSNSTHQEYNNEFLAMMFYNNFKVNDKPTDFCFILYDGRITGELYAYFNNVFSNSEDATTYLVAHELGHCIAAHKQQLGIINKEYDSHKREQIADMFAIGYFLYQNETEQALDIIKNVKYLPKTDIHFNSAQLEKFYTIFYTNKPKINNISDLFNITYQYYLTISST